MRSLAIFKRILLQRREDKRSLALLFVAPLLILTLMFFLLQVPSDTTYRVGLRSDNTTLTSKIKDESKFDVIAVAASNKSTMNDKSLDAIVSVSGADVTVTYANQSQGTTSAVKMLLAQILQTYEAKSAANGTQTAIKNLLAHLGPAAATVTLPTTTGTTLTLHTRYNYGNSNSTAFDDMAPAFVGGFVFFFVFLISGISLVNERTSGTLERMLVSPVKRSEIVAGYTLAYGLLALLQTAVIVSYTHWVLGMQVNGALAWVFLVNFLLALIALLAGLLLSALAKTEFQFVQFIPIAIVPQFLFSGIINVSTMAAPLQWIAHVTPVYYAIQALQLVIKRGEGFAQIGWDLLILVAISALLYLGNILALKNLRRT